MTRSGRTRILAFCAGTFATLVAACSLINGLDADYKLQSVTGGEGGQDGDPLVDGNTSDTKIDTSIPDGGADGPVVAFCKANANAANVVYCCDFEEADCAWTSSEATFGTITTDKGVGTNTSNVLLATVKNPAGSGRVYEQKQMTALPLFNTVVKHELSFAFAIKTRSALYGATLGAIGFGSPLKVIGVSVYKVAGPKDGIDVSDPPGSLTGTSMYVSPGEWRRASITMERAPAGGPYTTTVRVTDENGNSMQVDQRMGFDGGAAPTEILVGAFFTDNNADGGVETAIDDILLKQWN